MLKITNIPNNHKAMLITRSEAKNLHFGIGKGICICDNCGADIPAARYVFVSVLNRVLCQKCFEDFVKNCPHYEEDEDYETRHTIAMIRALGGDENSLDFIDYKDVDTDNADPYANISDKEAKEIFEDMQADNALMQMKAEGLCS